MAFYVSNSALLQNEQIVMNIDCCINKNYLELNNWLVNMTEIEINHSKMSTVATFYATKLTKNILSCKKENLSCLMRIKRVLLFNISYFYTADAHCCLIKFRA